eukprot:726432-Rhodomonas_salina.3
MKGGTCYGKGVFEEEVVEKEVVQPRVSLHYVHHCADCVYQQPASVLGRSSYRLLVPAARVSTMSTTVPTDRTVRRN